MTAAATARRVQDELEVDSVAVLESQDCSDKKARAAAWEALRQEVRSRGWTQPAVGRVLFDMAVAMSVAIGGSALEILGAGWGWKLVGLIIATTGWLGVATNIHTATHGATSKKPWVNDLISYLYPFLFNLSATSWWKSHIAVHHRAPNVMGVDGDCDLMPMFAITRPQFEASRGLARLYYRVQWIFLPLMLPLDGINRQIGSWRFLYNAIRDPQTRRREHFIDLAAMTGYWVCWFIVPIFVFGLPAGGVFAYHALRMMSLGYALFATFGPGHFPEQAVCYTPQSRPADFFERQLSASYNFESGLLRQFFVCGLQYQVEHHLFPSVSHCYYPRISKLVEKFAREQGLPYYTSGWLKSIWLSYRVFFVPKEVIGDPVPRD